MGCGATILLEADRAGPSHVRCIRDAGYHTAMFGKTHLYANHRNDGHTRDHAWKLHEWGYETVHELRDVVPTSRCTCHYADFLAARGRLRVYQDYTRLWWTERSGAPSRGGSAEHPPDRGAHRHVLRDPGGAGIRTYQEDRPFYLQVCFTGRTRRSMRRPNTAHALRRKTCRRRFSKHRPNRYRCRSGRCWPRAGWTA